ncbi:hypothetical protein FJR11_06300 [Anabaena sp. UHCC 0187]|uniref:hypothetical protein n=1 Tax=Anabaena sp. UHCC 0187 TaxID=2590018 RepID=UPI001444FDF0|nr:hypothetical protein [Anabaena sp. UHCC 0187]MTJ12213.1 hypothetical protein [Anabaena sp. UHCC 0187]
MIKSATYKRILNLGNYESKHLEIAYEVREDEDPLIKISELMELTERKIREEQATSIIEEITALRHELRKLKTEHREILNKINGNDSTTDDGDIF